MPPAAHACARTHTCSRARPYSTELERTRAWADGHDYWLSRGDGEEASPYTPAVLLQRARWKKELLDALGWLEERYEPEVALLESLLTRAKEGND